MGYATFARLVAQSPLIDGVVVVVTARRSAFLEGDLPKLKELKKDPASRCSCGPTRCRPTAASRSSTRPAIRCSPARSAAPAPWPRWRITARLRERMLKQPRAAPAPHPARDKVRASLASSGIGAVRMAGAAAARRLRHRRRQSRARWRIPPPKRKPCAQDDRRPGGAEGAIRRHSAQDRSRRGRAQYHRRRRARRPTTACIASAKRYAPGAHIDGVLVQPMARARPRSHPRHQSRRALGPAADGRAWAACWSRRWAMSRSRRCRSTATRRWR